MNSYSNYLSKYIYIYIYLTDISEDKFHVNRFLWNLFFASHTAAKPTNKYKHIFSSIFQGVKYLKTLKVK